MKPVQPGPDLSRIGSSPPELSRIVAVDRLPPDYAVQASPGECEALAARLRIEAVESLVCHFTLRRQGAVVTAQGVLRARVTQTCVVSLDPVIQQMEDRFTVRFVPEGREPTDDDPEAPDEIPYVGSVIDLGEAAVEQLALALDPYPRRPDAELDPAALDPEPSPFGSLAAFKPKD
jgi:uncharacterized metal-binding protein YceD (DUF177 family)